MLWWWCLALSSSWGWVVASCLVAGSCMWQLTLDADISLWCCDSVPSLVLPCPAILSCYFIYREGGGQMGGGNSVFILFLSTLCCMLLYRKCYINKLLFDWICIHLEHWKKSHQCAVLNALENLCFFSLNRTIHTWLAKRTASELITMTHSE